VFNATGLSVTVCISFDIKSNDNRYVWFSMPFPQTNDNRYVWFSMPFPQEKSSDEFSMKKWEFSQLGLKCQHLKLLLLFSRIYFTEKKEINFYKWHASFW
jgi:hypothetical protein